MATKSKKITCKPGEQYRFLGASGSYSNYIVCPSFYGFYLPLWYLQTFFDLVFCLTGRIKPGKVGEIFALYRLKSPFLDSKVNIMLPCFFLQVAPF